MELIRLLLIQQETGEEPPELKQYEEKAIVYNLALTIDAGLIEGTIIPNGQGEPCAVVIVRLTWAGHDFLDSTRDPKIWRLAKEKVIKPGISWSFTLLAEFLKAEAHRHIFGGGSPLP
jgi:hypothetical protein